MPILKRMLLALLLPVLPLFLFLVALSFAILQVAGQPEPIKKTLKESGIYTSAVDTFLESTNNPNEDNSAEISPDNPVVKEAFKKAFPPELLESSTENFIDSIYRWLNGQSPVPDFRIDLTQAKTTFIEEVAAGAEARAASLPACPRGQTEFGDPFSATCLPRGASPSLAADKIRLELNSNEAFLSNPVLTATSFKSDKDPQKSAFAGNSLPDAYSNLKNGRTILMILALLVIAGIIFLSSTLRVGIRRVGIVLLVVGIGILIAVFITNKAATEALPNILAKTENQALTDKLQILVRDLVQNTNQVFSVFGWGYTALGVGAIAGTIFIKRSKHPGQNSDSTSEEAKPEPDTKPAATKNTAKNSTESRPKKT